MNRKVIKDANAPNPIGSYNQAVIANGFVYTAGQIGVDPSTGKIVEESFKARVEQVFKNLSAVAEAAGGSLNDIVKLTIFLTDLNEFGVVNEIMAAHFNKPYPARATIEVSALPKGAAIEVEAILST